MAVPFDRKIILSTYVIPEIIYEEVLEEGTVKTYGTIFNVAEGGVGKALGAKSRSGEIQIAHEQLSDSWTTSSDGLVWDNIPDNHLWEDYSYWLAAPAVTGPMILRPTDATVFSETAPPVSFLWVKNVGDNNMLLSLDGGSTYPVIIKPFASFAARVISMDSDNIMVDIESGDTTVEYLIAF